MKGHHIPKTDTQVISELGLGLKLPLARPPKAARVETTDDVCRELDHDVDFSDLDALLATDDVHRVCRELMKRKYVFFC